MDVRLTSGEESPPPDLGRALGRRSAPPKGTARHGCGSSGVSGWGAKFCPLVHGVFGLERGANGLRSSHILCWP